MGKCVHVCAGAVIGSGWTRLDIQTLQLAHDNIKRPQVQETWIPNPRGLGKADGENCEFNVAVRVRESEVKLILFYLVRSTTLIPTRDPPPKKNSLLRMKKQNESNNTAVS